MEREEDEMREELGELFIRGEGRSRLDQRGMIGFLLLTILMTIVTSTFGS
jgi:hypothetical protein